jgi:hypothetical protein
MKKNIFKINSFISKQDCGMIVNRLNNAIELNQGGEYLNNAVNQFNAYMKKGGGYFSNIVASPHFSQKEIETVLKLANMPAVRLHLN